MVTARGNPPRGGRTPVRTLKASVFNYDFIPLWNAGRRWQNRYQWARTSGYASAVKAPSPVELVSGSTPGMPATFAVSEHGKVLVPGKSAESILVHNIAHLGDPDNFMPPPKNKAGIGPLTAEQVGLVRAWIDQGAK